MKKLVLTIVVAVGLIGTSFGQGYVTVAGTFQNLTNTTVLDSTFLGGTAAGGTTGAIQSTTAGGAYSMELLTAAFTGTTNSTQLFGNATLGGWLDTSLFGHNNTFAGRLTIGTDILANNAPIGTQNQWLLVAWSTALGNWAQVSAALEAGTFTSPGYLGWSLVGIGAAGSPPNATPLTIQGTSGSIIPQGMQLLAVPVPEPTTIALASLGGLSLLAFRRRNKA